MRVDLYLQFRRDLTLPAMPVRVNSGSALPLELYGIPAVVSGATVTGVSVQITNANSEPLTATCTKIGDAWVTLFASSGFVNYGTVKNGFKAMVTCRRQDGVSMTIHICGDFEVVASSASAVPGSQSTAYQIAGGDVYKKTQVIGGVQHYIKEQMAYDADIGWGAEWVGDYVKSNDGQFIPFVQEV